MLVELLSNQSETDSSENLYARMERPKSAKYNLERYKKASAHASRFNKAQGYPAEGSQSAYAGRLRPKSARHGLDRHRQEAAQQVVEPAAEEEAAEDEDELDDLEGLLIGEDDSGSEPDSLDQERRKKPKTKLLSKRALNARPTVGPHVLLSSLPNKTSNFNTYTTFRPTAVTTNYSTSHTGLKVVHLHPDKENESLDQTNASLNTTTTANSSSSSSTSSSKLQPVLQEHTDNTDRFKNSHIEATSRELLSDWLRKDDDVDINVKHDDDVIDENLVYTCKYQKSVKTGRLGRGPVSGRTTRSDFSSNSSFSHAKTGDSAAFFNREKSGMSDPWAKRNPTLIAQNVLLKHRAELEQITANRTNNTSRTSTTPNLLAHATLNRCLLPDTKYFKK
ncbi:hypothetical protein BpHYR1_034764 [Brachionus plicatilis]|uniref:Uncharacterized protein n=1 Tax=Brachionus plicatilis TaxID=10195 RepID=A0A3M7S1U6_BRAPC|nr:hypothetical protein BpHYR1_034764 [Brachionus plicatilis]